MSATTNNSWRGQWLGWLCLAILVSLTWLPYSYYLMVSWPWIALWQVGFLLLGTWAIWMLRQLQLPFRFLGYGLDWVVGLVLVTLILSAIFSEFKQLAVWNVSLALFYGILLYVLRNWLGFGGFTLVRLSGSISLIGVVTSLISLVVWQQQYTIEEPRNGWPFGHPNFVAGYLVLIIPVTIALAFSGKVWQKVGALVASVLFIGVLYTTSSRGGFLGFLVFLLVAAGFIIWRSRGKDRSIAIVGLVISLAILVSIAFSNSRVRQIIRVSSPTENALPVQVTVDNESQDRLFMWQAGFKIFQTHPILGVGPGNMSRIYDRYRPIETGGGLAHLQQLHNTPIQILGELGLLGLSAYLLLIGSLSFLWYRLDRQLTQTKDGYLLYGIGGGLLAYIVSSLTDYQLENIGISSTIVLLIILLIGLADRASLAKSNSISSQNRHWFSLGSIVILVITIFIWLPVTRAMQLSATSEKIALTGDMAKAYEKSSQAADLVPWDPTYNMLAGFQALNLRQNVREPELFKELTEVVLGHFQKVVEAAPNDATFNQNLGILERDAKQVDRASFHFSKATQLLPRSPLKTYYLLGREYLQQNQVEQAINAFALQGLITPEFLTSKLWDTSNLSQIKEPVFQETTKLLSKLLQQISPTDYNYNQIYEQLVLLKWWDEKPIDKLDLDRLTPIAKALLALEKSPQSALEIINANLKSSPNSKPLLLLRAWIDPQKYLNDYLNNNFTGNLAETDTKSKQLIKESIYRQRKIRDWLSSLENRSEYLPKIATILTYRNYHSRTAAYILLPTELENNLIVQWLDLFPPFSSVFPPLDRLVDKVRTEKLNLPHPNAKEVQNTEVQ